jgi:hypothetical protein
MQCGISGFRFLMIGLLISKLSLLIRRRSNLALYFTENIPMKMPSLEKKIVSIGYTGIELVDEKDIDKNQVGYSNLPNGESLIGNESGDWKKDWVVIGYETGCRDPIFIDTSDPNFPVYTAVHGEGNWNPNLISSTYRGLLQIIEKLKIFAIDRE